MRFRLLNWCAFHLPVWAWHLIPFAWRYWWAGEWSARSYGDWGRP